MVEVRDVKLANLADATRLCVGTNLPPGLDAFGAMDLQRAKLAFFRGLRGDGAGAVGAYRDGILVGTLEWFPLEHSPTPVAGKDLFVVNCLRVPGKEGRGEVVEALVRAAEPHWEKRAGVALVAREKEWEAFGFHVVERRNAPEVDGGIQVLWLRRFRPEAEVRFIEVQPPPKPEEGRLRVDLYLSDRCPWNGWVFEVVKKACASYSRPVRVVEHDCRTRAMVERTGVGAAVAINGVFQPLLRPHLLPDERTVRRILDLA